MTLRLRIWVVPCCEKGDFQPEQGFQTFQLVPIARESRWKSFYLLNPLVELCVRVNLMVIMVVFLSFRQTCDVTCSVSFTHHITEIDKDRGGEEESNNEPT